MTFWYAPASADADVHFSPSLLPLQPPKDTMTSPPAPRIALIFAWSSPPVSGREPSHIGLQPPSVTVSRSTLGPPLAVVAVARTVLAPALSVAVTLASCQVVPAPVTTKGTP